LDRDGGRRQPIGIFDSGVGGLTFAGRLERVLPAESYIYLADTANVPYGGRSLSEVARLSLTPLHYLARAGVKMIVIACNTACAAVYDRISAELAMPVIGVVEAGARATAAAVRGRRTPNIALVATRATVASEVYRRALARQGLDGPAFARTCDGLVELVEGGTATGPEVERVVARGLSGLPKDLDALILGCTHYAHVRGVMAALLGGGGTVIIDPAVETAWEVAATLRRLGLDAPPVGRDAPPVGRGPGTYRYLVTGEPERFARVATALLGRVVRNVESVSFGEDETFEENETRP
jgi:glutamate racemase